MKHSKAFCTIITNNYFSWALSLYDSLQKFDKDIILYVAVVDHTFQDHSDEISGKNIKILTLDDLGNIKFSEEIINKYKDQLNVLRWALKPIVISKCLEFIEKVIFTDADIYFFNPYQFLFDYLDTHHILLTPHWSPMNPSKNKIEFETIFKNGIYNAGFIGAKREGRDVIEFWAESCYTFCGKNAEVGLHYDQTYLNLFPIYYDNVLVIKHKGCNVASWNIEICERKLDPINNEVKIIGEYPIIFIHFTNVTIDGILKNTDPLLKNHLLEFNNTMIKNGFRDIIKERLAYFERLIKEENETDWDKLIKRIKRVYYKIRY
ncbi:hypothetical protein [uncultured Chryseobacterium sp.]|uniref:hypothetical protein n=1 Tax=uncultured Chryseobacterium sp. TaxID=259322 RepID=UPI0025FFD157|nr:hypothetical protein [uncultured Chryseobacterium sp.]